MSQTPSSDTNRLPAAFRCRLPDRHRFFLEKRQALPGLPTEGMQRAGWAGQVPAVSEEAAIGVARTITARSRAGGPLVLQRLPGERGAIDGTLFLPPGGQRAARRTSV